MLAMTTSLNITGREVPSNKIANSFLESESSVSLSFVTLLIDAYLSVYIA